MILNHSIVGQSLTSLTIRKDREYAACRICGAIFQSILNTVAVSDEEYNRDPSIKLAAQLETIEWRHKHNLTHSEREHLAFRASGRTLSPEAAHKLAPFGIAVLDGDEEVAAAMLAAPRAPVDDVESTVKGVY